MYNDMVSDVGTFVRYLYDSFGGCPSSVITMVISKLNNQKQQQW